MGIVLFRIDLGARVGGGHYSRCLSIAHNLSGIKVAFLIRQCGDIDSKLCRLPDHYVLPPKIAFLNEAEYIREHFNQISTLVLDITHQETLKNDKTRMPEYLHKIRVCAGKVMVIDGIGDGALLSFPEKCSLDALVTPYVGSRLLKGDFIHLCGERYFVLPNYRKPQISKEFVKRGGVSGRPVHLLLTFGQSDPCLLTEFSISHLGKLLSDNKGILTRVIVGPLVSEDRTRKIQKSLVSLNIKHQIRIAPRSLQGSYEWGDVAISATGLSKYEMAYFGLPAILISATQLDETLQFPFDCIGVAEHLGYFHKLGVDCLVRALKCLVNDDHRRIEMSAKGKELIDGQGGARVAEMIMSLGKSVVV